MSAGFLVAWLPPDVYGYHLVLARERHAQTICLQSTCTLSVTVVARRLSRFLVGLSRLLSSLVVVSCSGQLDLAYGVVGAIVLLMTDQREPISEAALEAVANLLATAQLHSIDVSFEPDAIGCTVGYIQGTGGGNLASAYDLETAVRAAERPLDELAARLSEARVARQG